MYVSEFTEIATRDRKDEKNYFGLYLKGVEGGLLYIPFPVLASGEKTTAWKKRHTTEMFASAALANKKKKKNSGRKECII